MKVDRRFTGFIQISTQLSGGFLEGFYRFYTACQRACREYPKPSGLRVLGFRG